MNSRKLGVIVSLQLNNLNTVQNYLTPQMNTTFKANPVATTNTLERTPTTDTLIKPTTNKTKKTLLTLGAIATAGIGITYAIKKAHVKDVKRLHKALKEGFLNESLTEKEALAIKQRYNDLAKIKDRDEYARAIFEETKKNFGLDTSNITLKFGELKGAGGGYNPKEHFILITPTKHKEDLLETICHEFRHVKQMQIASNLEPNFAKIKIDKNLLKEETGKIVDSYIDKGITDINDEMMGKIVSEAKDKIVLERFGKLSENNIPESLKEYANKILESLKNAKDPTKDLRGYWNCYHEVDARKAGSSIDKFVKEKAFNIDYDFPWISNFEMKVRSWIQSW